MKKLIAIALLMLAGCAAPMHQGPTTAADPNTDASVVERAGGFDIAVTYSIYQFIPQPDVVRGDCRSAVTSLAQAHARKQGRKATIDEQTIRTSVGRNLLLGVTTCEASGSASYL